MTYVLKGYENRLIYNQWYYAQEVWDFDIISRCDISLVTSYMSNLHVHMTAVMILILIPTEFVVLMY